MIKEAYVTAIPKNKAAKYVFLGLVGTALILAVLANLGAGYSGIIWLAALIFATSAIYVYNRFVGAAYLYEVRMDGGIPSFVVAMRVGKTSKVLARLDLSSIVEVREMSRKEYRSHRCEKGIVKYAYYPTMSPDSLYLVSVRSQYENLDVLIEADAELAEALTQLLE